MAPPVASVLRSTFMSRPKGLIGTASSGLTTTARKGEILSSIVFPHCCASIAECGEQRY
jgi:hypothetical protein